VQSLNFTLNLERLVVWQMNGSQYVGWLHVHRNSRIFLMLFNNLGYVSCISGNRLERPSTHQGPFRIRLDLLRSPVLLIEDMLLHRVVLIQQLRNQLPVFFALDSQSVSCLFHLYDSVSFLEQSSLALL